MPTPSSAQVNPIPQRRELYFFNLFRVLEAGILALVAFTPLGQWSVDIQQPLLLKFASLVYLIASAGLLIAGRRIDKRLRRQTAIGLLFDLSAIGCALLAMNGGESGIAMFMVFNIGAGALILTPSASLGFALAGSALLMIEYLFNQLFYPAFARTIAEPMMYSVTYIGMAIMGQQLRKQMSASQALAEKRGEELANLSELNELVIRRMRTGVLVVDGGHHIRLSNEAAWALMGNPSPDRRDLAEVAPSLHQSLWLWRQGRGEVPKAMTFAEGSPEVLPRFVALSLTDKLFLIFLDDSRIYSDRAEELTLSTLGRLSASIAHEIRNPLAAISYSVQLLEESQALPDTDRRLLEIIHSQCQRMNGIVQNILGLARRERSQTISLELNAFIRHFAEEYRTNHPLETDVLQAIPGGRLLVAMVDPQHLHQVLTVLVHNALTYGREPGKPAQVTLSARSDGPQGPPLLEVIDRGPGIPAKVAEQIFAPFFTTNEHGTGLGLYIAKQLCEANLCTLSFQPVPGGGSCFRITLPASQSLVQQDQVTG
ncbi:MAG TPA: ATP-binding protein [Arenimonas sp.]|uniref:sensor histidine kinase n=1 Tax=Arenimonas sp. TaxID=1872635 RepID=UPI002CAEC767|nr:ATP-binding protein [Arenimonas sp.]HMB56369.1 ATP-binding protein [Arenimonas sp.]